MPYQRWDVHSHLLLNDQGNLPWASCEGYCIDRLTICLPIHVVLQICSQLPYQPKRSQEFLHNVGCGMTEQHLCWSNSFRHFSNEMSTLSNHSLSFQFISYKEYEQLYHSTLVPMGCTKSPWHRAHFKVVADIITLHADRKFNCSPTDCSVWLTDSPFHTLTSYSSFRKLFKHS